MLRRFATLAAVLGVTLAVLPVSPANGAQSLSGTFVAHFGRGAGAPNDACPPETFCGAGILSGFGEGTQVTEFTSFEPIDGTPCAEVTIVQAITVAQGTLVLDERGLFCSPGQSDSAPTSPSAYGHPHTIQLDYDVDGAASTGVFSDATGTGTESIHIAGDSGTSQLTGSLVLAS
jgi:hypothetical protein